MTLACVLLRHDIRPRWIGDLLAHYCATCDDLIITGPDLPVSGPRRVVPPVARRRAAHEAVTA